METRNFIEFLRRKLRLHSKPSEAGLNGRGETKAQGVFNACVKCVKCGFDFDDVHLEN